MACDVSTGERLSNFGRFSAPPTCVHDVPFHSKGATAATTNHHHRDLAGWPVRRRSQAAPSHRDPLSYHTPAGTEIHAPDPPQAPLVVAHGARPATLRALYPLPSRPYGDTTFSRGVRTCAASATPQETRPPVDHRRRPLARRRGDEPHVRSGRRLALLKSHGAHATFFVCSDYLSGVEAEADALVCSPARPSSAELPARGPAGLLLGGRRDRRRHCRGDRQNRAPRRRAVVSRAARTALAGHVARVPRAGAAPRAGRHVLR